jgi:hypothetical protein
MTAMEATDVRDAATRDNDRLLESGSCSSCSRCQCRFPYNEPCDPAVIANVCPLPHELKPHLLMIKKTGQSLSCRALRVGGGYGTCSSSTCGHKQRLMEGREEVVVVVEG